MTTHRIVRVNGIDVDGQSFERALLYDEGQADALPVYEEDAVSLRERRERRENPLARPLNHSFRHEEIAEIWTNGVDEEDD